MRICFVTSGISPFVDGNNETLYGNLLSTYNCDRCEQHVLLYGAETITEAEFHSVYPNVTLHSLSIAPSKAAIELPGQMSDLRSFDSMEAWTSYIVMRKLEQIEKSGCTFDIIEFIDTAGTAFFSIQQKRLGHRFQETDIVIRLLGSDSRLRRFETRPWLYANMSAADIEQQAIAQADYCVSHTLPNAKSYQSHYNLPDTWLERLRIELPPIEVQYPATSTITIDQSTNLCFSSDLREANRPQIFLASACEFIASTPDYKGVALITGTDTNASFLDSLKSSVPTSLKERILWTQYGNDQIRSKIVSKSVAIFASVFEISSINAVQASLSGAAVVLNELNPAFGPDSCWQHGINCLKFDGSVDGLTFLLRRIYDHADTNDRTHQLRPIKYRHAENPHWLRAIPATAGKEALSIEATSAPVSVIIPVKDSPQTLVIQLQDIAELTDRSYEIVVVDHASQNSALEHLLDALEAGDHGIRGNHAVRVLRRTQASNYAVAMNAGIAAASHSVVAVLPGRQRDTSGFIGAAADVIATDRADVVLPIVRIVKHYDDLDITQYWSPLGSAPRTNLFTNRFGFGCFVTKRDALLDQRFDESLIGEWSWDVLLRLSFSGRSFAIDSDRGVSLTADDVIRWSAGDEARRRILIETIRRNAFHISRKIDFPWEALGDGELTSSEWHIGRNSQIILKQELDKLRLTLEQETEKNRLEIANAKRLVNVHREEALQEHLIALQENEILANARLEEERQQHQATRDAFAMLANARTVRLALSMGNFIKRIAGR